MKADELWDQFSGAEGLDGSLRILKADFLAALAEYGQAVRERDAEICREMARNIPDPTGACEDCDAAISREPLP